MAAELMILPRRTGSPAIQEREIMAHCQLITAVCERAKGANERETWKSILHPGQLIAYEPLV